MREGNSDVSSDPSDLDDSSIFSEQGDLDDSGDHREFRCFKQPK